MLDFGTEKKQCFDDYENGSLIMSDEKCEDEIGDMMDTRKTFWVTGVDLYITIDGAYDYGGADKLVKLPSAQPEIIRCKDCRFAALTYDGDCKYCQYLEGEFGLTDAVYFDGNDYCSHAERRTDEGD